MAIFAALVAIWTRWAYNARLQHQTIWHVVVGVGGVVIITGLKIGMEAAAFVLLCFVPAGFSMGIEYFSRVKQEEMKAQQVREESIDVDAGANREA